MNNKLLPIALIIVLIVGCKSEDQKQKKSGQKTQEREQVFIPEFDADSAYNFIDKQMTFGPRVPGTPAHVKCARYLSKTMERLADEVVVQDFKARDYAGKTLNGKNIIGIFQPDKKARILLGAHWDSRFVADHDPVQENQTKPVPGANDGASGVGVLLEIARQLNQHAPDVGIDIIFFDLEDQGEPEGLQMQAEDDWALGSQHWSKSPHKPGYRAKYGILLDMVGVSDAVFGKEGTSVYYARHLLEKVWSIARDIGYENYFIDEETPSILDDHFYVNQIAKIPMIDIIQYDRKTYTGFFEYWHTINDTMEHIDPATLKVVGEVVLQVIYME
ncbi:MAG: M28 family peptidase [Bacteroidales bacterium]|nr:M28 family peptidase [Bacteroidales bacterium]MCF8350895.1 M28 family peptidase [Bacteroidales bacterium]MCF8376917.1 M28 family peptidase [Bacteroidales bacterium]MCF8400814.1 M28 family peptidase [Bacteroidales bacterium]